MFLFLACVLVGFVSASVEVHSYFLEKFYPPFEQIKGEINLTIVDEGFGAKVTSNDKGRMDLGKFLADNGVIYDCSPPDCSDGYEVLKSGENMTFSIPAIGVVYGGFVLNGDNVEVTGIRFDIKSDFIESSNLPISIDFFEGSEWEFEEFSGEYSGEDWGCYNPTVPVIGPPIRKSVYCEMISISDTNALYVGAEVDKGDVVDLKMSVYPELGGNDLGNCLFNPGVERGCVINADVGEVFSAGNYQVCVGAPDSLENTNYKLFQENVGAVCGFVYSLGPGTGSEDYAIFVKEAKYAGASYFSSEDLDFGSLLVAADSLINKKYNRNCSEGCVLPFAISGVAQNVSISNVVVDYFDGGRDAYVEESSTLNILPAMVDFSGILDLSILGFDVSKSMVYKIFLGGVELLSEEVVVLPAPIVSSVSPLNPPAGVPIEFRALVQFDGGNSLSYKWAFGDGGVASTNEPFVVHTYENLSNYSMSIEVSAGGNLSSKKTFLIKVISPEAAVNEMLFNKRKYLDGIIDLIGGLPSWYSGALSKAIDVDFFNGELKRLEKARNNSVGVEDFIKIAKDLYALDVPVGLVYDSFNSPGLMTEFNDIDVGVVAEVGGGEADDGYKNTILVWQSTYIVANVSSREFSILKMDGGREVVFNVYEVGVKSTDYVESYFVIDKSMNDLFFKESVGERKVDDATVVVLDREGSESFSFYYEGVDGASFFVSPKLSSLVIGENVDVSCNFNFVCDAGEDYKNCRSDCKPIGRAIFYIVLVLVLVLVLYGFLQVWYKRRYENYLFKDGQQLYNLLMYVTNARARGVGDLRTRSELRAKGWSSERVDYVLKKSRGEMVGMYEILPIGKIAAWLRNRRARRSVTKAQQQIRQNINKSEFQW